jgi:hypothetical protein
LAAKRRGQGSAEDEDVAVGLEEGDRDALAVGDELGLLVRVPEAVARGVYDPDALALVAAVAVAIALMEVAAEAEEEDDAVPVARPL